jgi:hypothetical protein
MKLSRQLVTIEGRICSGKTTKAIAEVLKFVKTQKKTINTLHLIVQREIFAKPYIEKIPDVCVHLNAKEFSDHPIQKDDLILPVKKIDSHEINELIFVFEDSASFGKDVLNLIFSFLSVSTKCKRKGVLMPLSNDKWMMTSKENIILVIDQGNWKERNLLDIIYTFRQRNISFLVLIATKFPKPLNYFICSMDSKPSERNREREKDSAYRGSKLESIVTKYIY